MTVRTEPHEVRSVLLEDGGKRLAIHCHKGGYGPTVSIQMEWVAPQDERRNPICGMSAKLEDLFELRDALDLMLRPYG